MHFSSCTYFRGYYAKNLYNAKFCTFTVINFCFSLSFVSDVHGAAHPKHPGLADRARRGTGSVAVEERPPDSQVLTTTRSSHCISPVRLVYKYKSGLVLQMWIYCKRRYFRAAKFSRIKPHVTFYRGQMFAHLISISI